MARRPTPTLTEAEYRLMNILWDLGSATVDSIASMVLGATVSAMWMVLEGHQTWREAGSSTAELVLRAMGIAPDEARQISTTELPRLAT